jgi:hypothetical protein
MYWYTGISMGVTPDGKDVSFRAVTIISAISCPVMVTRLIAESPPTFTVWQPSGPAPRGKGVDDGAGRGSSALPEPSVGAGAGVGEDVRVGVGEEVSVGVGEEVSVGVGEDVSVGVGEDVSVGVGVGEVVGTVVSGGATTVTYPERLRVLTIVKFWTVRFTVYVPGATYT